MLPDPNVLAKTMAPIAVKKWKRVRVDWGYYTVDLHYNPEDINEFIGYYHAPGRDWDGAFYRKFTKPEIRAALEAIYKNEEMKIMPINTGNDGMPGEFGKYTDKNKVVPAAGPTPSRGWRDHLAYQAMNRLLEKLPLTDFFKHNKLKKVAEFSYIMADEMMEAREPKVEVCKHCKQPILPNHGC